MWNYFKVLNVIIMCILSLPRGFDLIGCRSIDYLTIVTEIYNKTFFLNNIKFCGNSFSKVVIYDKCTIEHIVLPVDLIKEAFPSVRTIRWNCGFCYIKQETDLKILGCTSGNKVLVIFSCYYINFFNNIQSATFKLCKSVS